MSEKTAVEQMSTLDLVLMRHEVRRSAHLEVVPPDKAFLAEVNAELKRREIIRSMP